MPARLLLVCEITPLALALAAFERVGRRLMLRHQAVERLAPGTAAGPHWLDDLARAGRELAERPWARGEVHVGLAGGLTLGRAFAVPRLGRAQRERVIRFEAQHALPHRLVELEWAYAQGDSAPAELTVWVSAARRDVVGRVLAAFAPTGLLVCSVESVPWAIARRAAGRRLPGAPLVVVLTGAGGVDVVVVDGPRSSVRWVALDDAAAGATGLASSSGTSESRLVRIQQEVRRSLAHLRRQGGRAPAVVRFAPGHEGDADLIEPLAAALQLPVERLPDEPGLGPGLDREPAGRLDVWTALLAGAAGLALPPLNLLPAAEQQARAVRRRRPWLQGAAAALALGAALLAHDAQRDLADVRQRIEDGDTRQFRDRAAAAAWATAAARSRAVRGEIRAWRRLQVDRSAWLRLLADLHGRIRGFERAWIERIETATPAREAAMPGDGADARGPVELILVGCLLDPSGATGAPGSEAFARARGWLEAVAGAAGVIAVEDERFEADGPTLLRVRARLRVQLWAAEADW